MNNISMVTFALSRGVQSAGRMGNDWVDAPNCWTCQFEINLDIFQSGSQLARTAAGRGPGRTNHLVITHDHLTNQPTNQTYPG